MKIPAAHPSVEASSMPLGALPNSVWHSSQQPPRVEASQLPLESLAGNSSVSDADKVAEVSRQFEAVLLRQILQDIRKPLLAPAEGDATANGIYADMINNQMADSISRSGGFGLAKSLTSQLTRQVLPHASAAVEAGQPSLQAKPVQKQTRK
jgi:Rod binding domain-containing protein